MLVINLFVFLTYLFVCECGLSPTQRVKITSSINNQKAITSRLERLIANPKGFSKVVSLGKDVFDFASVALPLIGPIYQGIGFIDELINGPKEDPVMVQFGKIKENFRELDKKLDSLEKVLMMFSYLFVLERIS